jgi:RNA polymerase sigma-70 factor (ECF subfamily)
MSAPGDQNDRVPASQEVMSTEACALGPLEAALSGDREAWEALVSGMLPAVLQWGRRLGGPGVDPCDVAQDVFVVAFTRLDRVADPRAFPAWLYGITRRVLAGHRRRAWLRRWVPGLDPADCAPTDGPADERGELARQVLAALERLPAAQREVLVLCDMEERTSAEVAALIGVPHGTVRSRLRLARARFQREAEALGLTGAG